MSFKCLSQGLVCNKQSAASIIMGMMIIMMNFALRQMTSFLWAFLFCHPQNTGIEQNESSIFYLCPSVTWWLAFRGRWQEAGHGCRGCRGAMQMCCVPVVWWLKGVLYRQSSHPLLYFSQSKTFSFLFFRIWGFDHFANIFRLHWHIFCFRNTVEKVSKEFIMCLNSQNHKNQ